MNPMTRYDTLGRLDGLFDELFRPALAWRAEGEAQPLPLRVDVKEAADAYTVYAELPGVAKDGIGIEIEGDEVTISAATRREAPREGEKWLRLERTFGRAERRFALPQEIDGAKAVARFADGVLQLTLPKKAAVAARRIPVN